MIIDYFKFAIDLYFRVYTLLKRFSGELSTIVAEGL